jgi:hypothetical protein
MDQTVAPKAAHRRLRDRRYRARKSRCVAVVPVEIDGEMINFLLRARWLYEDEAHDKRQIGEAIAAMLSDAADMTEVY